MKDRFTYMGLNLRLTSNTIRNNRIINVDSGKTVTQPINTNGDVSLNFYGGTGMKIKKINTRIQIGPNFYYSKMAEVINSQTSYSKTLNAGVYFNADKSKDKKYDLSFSDNFSYSSNRNSQTNSTSHFFSNILNINATLYIHKTWSINTDYELQSRQKITQSSGNLNNQLWNAKLQKTFKKDEFTFYFKVRDILNQNVGITRSFYSNTYTEQQNDRLKRYWLLGFAWNFKNKNAIAKK